MTVDVGSSAFAQALIPSFAIGGYLILLAVFIQVYACLQSESDSGEKNSNWNRDPITIDDIVTPLKLFILLIGIPSSIFILFAFTIPILSTVSPSISTDTVDICDCLTNPSYYNNNENDCDKAINKELGHNWKTTNYSQEPSKSAKFDALAERCNSGSSSNQSSSSSYSSCTSGGAKSFAVDRLNSTIGTTQFLDLHKDNGDSWLFYGSVYSSQYSRDVTVFVLIGCSGGSYSVLNVDVQL